ncbi:hypothetical protein WJX74_002881 [Apatococcus lobatus]|uniref:Uncharacterized protein n=1 Tax=Apatococcus lobatus TaxID=904363 RepID=A0AAW1REK9_9CHLO
MAAAQSSRAAEQQDWVASWTLVQGAPEPDSRGHETEVVNYIYETGQAEQPHIPQEVFAQLRENVNRDLASRNRGSIRVQNCQAGIVPGAPGQPLHVFALVLLQRNPASSHLEQNQHHQHHQAADGARHPALGQSAWNVRVHAASQQPPAPAHSSDQALGSLLGAACWQGRPPLQECPSSSILQAQAVASCPPPAATISQVPAWGTQSPNHPPVTLKPGVPTRSNQSTPSPPATSPPEVPAPRIHSNTHPPATTISEIPALGNQSNAQLPDTWGKSGTQLPAWEPARAVSNPHASPHLMSGSAQLPDWEALDAARLGPSSQQLCGGEQGADRGRGPQVEAQQERHAQAGAWSHTAINKLFETLPGSGAGHESETRFHEHPPVSAFQENLHLHLTSASPGSTRIAHREGSTSMPLLTTSLPLGASAGNLAPLPTQTHHQPPHFRPHTSPQEFTGPTNRPSHSLHPSPVQSRPGRMLSETVGQEGNEYSHQYHPPQWADPTVPNALRSQIFQRHPSWVGPAAPIQAHLQPVWRPTGGATPDDPKLLQRHPQQSLPAVQEPLPANPPLLQSVLLPEPFEGAMSDPVPGDLCCKRGDQVQPEVTADTAATVALQGHPSVVTTAVSGTGPRNQAGAASHPQRIAGMAGDARQQGGLLLSGLMRAEGLLQEPGYGACQVASTFLASLLDTAQLQAEGMFDELCPSTMPNAITSDRRNALQEMPGSLAGQALSAHSMHHSMQQTGQPVVGPPDSRPQNRNQSPREPEASDDDDASDMDSFAPVHSFTTAWDPPSLHFYTSPFQRRYQPPHPLSPPHAPLSVGSAGSAGQSTPTSGHMPAGDEWPATQMPHSPETLKKVPEPAGPGLGQDGGLGMEFSNSGNSSQTDADLIAALRDTWDDSGKGDSPRDAAALQWQGASLNLISQDGLHHWDSDGDSSVPSPSQCDAQSVLLESLPRSWLQEMLMPHTQSPPEIRQSPQVPVAHLQQTVPHQHGLGPNADGASKLLLCEKQQGHQDAVGSPGCLEIPDLNAQHIAADEAAKRLLRCQQQQKQQHLPLEKKVPGGSKQQQQPRLMQQPVQQLLQGSQAQEQHGSVPDSWRLWSQSEHVPTDKECRRSAVLSCPSNIPTPCQPPVGPRYTQSSSPSAQDSLTPPPTVVYHSDGHRLNLDHRRGRIGSSVYGVRMSHGGRDGSSTDAENPGWQNPTHASSSPDDRSVTAPTEWTSPSGEASPSLEMIPPSWPGRNAHRLRVKALEGGNSGHQMGCGDENGGHIPPTRRSIRHPIALLAPKAPREQRGHTHQLPPAQLDGPSEGSCTSQVTHFDAADFPRPGGTRRSAHAQKWYSEPPTHRPPMLDKRNHAAGCPSCSQDVGTRMLKQAGNQGGVQRRGTRGGGRRPWQRQAQTARMGAGNRRRGARTGPHPGWTTSPESSSCIPSHASSWSSPEAAHSPPHPQPSHPVSTCQQASLGQSPKKPIMIEPAQDTCLNASAIDAAHEGKEACTNRPPRILSGEHHRAAQTPPPPQPSPQASPGLRLRRKRFSLLRPRFLFPARSPKPAHHTPLPHPTSQGLTAITPHDVHMPKAQIMDSKGELVLHESQLVTPPHQVKGFGRGKGQGKHAGGLVPVGGEGFGRKGGALHLPTIIGDLFKRLNGRGKARH